MKATFAIIAICLVGFFYPVYFVEDIDGFYQTYAFSGQNFVERPYVLITSIFLHDGVVHLLSNLFILFFFGISLEKEIGPLKMLSLFFIGAFLGDMLSLLVYPFDALSVGASAGIFAVIGAGILLCPLGLSFYPFIVPVPLALLGILYVLYNFYGFIMGYINPDPADKISYIAHFGGIIVGLAYGFRKRGIKKGFKIIMISLLAIVLVAVLSLLLLG